MSISFPSSKEYAPFYAGYIQQLSNVTDILQTLQQEGHRTYELFKAIPTEKQPYRYAEDKWSIKELLGHLIDVEQIMAYRALAFYRKESQSLTGFNEDAYVEAANFDAIPYEMLLQRYQATRAASLALFSTFEAEKTTRIGTANDVDLSVRALIYIIAGHEQHHIKILKERYL